MTRAGFAATALLLLGCASVPAARAHPAGDVLEARLYEPLGGQLGFAVSRPAYVAIFEVAPDGRMAMLYPMAPTQIQRRFSSGYHTYASAGSGFSQRLYTHASSFRTPLRPTYLVLIASERPLRLQRLRGAYTARGLDFGFSAPFSSRSFGAERLAEHLVPDPELTAWGYDVYEVWPAVPLVPVSGYRVVCADGTIRVIRTARVPPECRGVRPRQPPRDTVSAPPRDSGRIDPRRRPGPPRAEPGPGGRRGPERSAEAGQRRPGGPAERAAGRPDRVRESGTSPSRGERAAERARAGTRTEGPARPRPRGDGGRGRSGDVDS